jgi:ankyrin repeat protein
VVLGRELCSKDFFDSLECYFTGAKERSDNIVLRLDPDLLNRSMASEGQLYARLCVQLLDQQPSLILWLRHLYPNLRDAIMGSNLKWKTRCLLRCLRTLLLTPKDGDTYCLIHRGPEGSREVIISQLLVVAQESEVPFRLLVSTETAVEMELSSETFCRRIDLASEKATLAARKDLDNRSQSLIRHRLSLGSAKGAISSLLNSRIDFQSMDLLTVFLGDIALLQASLPSLPAAWGLDDTYLPTVMLSRCVDNGLSWVIRAVAWIKYAIRPLSRVELQRILEIECAREDRCSIQEDFRCGDVLFSVLQRALPGVLWICDEAVLLRQDLEYSSYDWFEYFPNKDDPDMYIAKTCLDILQSVFEKSSQAAQTSTDTEVKATRNATQTVKEVGGPELTPQHIPDQVISKYAARYWMEHYRRVSPDLALKNSSFLSLLDKKSRFDLNAWAHYLVSTSWSSDISEDLRNKALPQTLEQLFGLGHLESSYLSFRIATLPLSVGDDFESLLLDIASEAMTDATYLDMVRITCESLSSGRLARTLQRVIAAAPSNLRDQLVKTHDGFFHDNFLQIFMTSIALGNAGSLVELLAKTPVPPQDDEKAKEISDILGTPLQVACEYGDVDMVTEILKQDDLGSSLDMERPFRWNALHVACQLGQRKIVDTLTTIPGANRLIHSPWLPHFNPLLITSSRGLVGISKSLAHLDGLRMVAEPPADEDLCPTQLASKYGFLQSLGWLLDDQNSTVSTGSPDNSAICLALRSGNAEVAARVLKALMGGISVTASPERKHRRRSPSVDTEDDDSSMSDTSDELEAPLTKADAWKAMALIEAVQCGGIQPVLDTLLGCSNLNVRDSKGRTPLIIAAMNGSVDLVKKLLKFNASVHVKDESDISVISHACRQGHLDVVKVLAEEKDFDPTLRNWRGTPATVAASEGHYHILRFLLPIMTIDAIKTEFVRAGGRGQDGTARLILKFVTDKDINARGIYINAKDIRTNTALHYAAANDRPRLVQFLLQRGAGLEVTDSSGMTPLADATKAASLEALKLLLEAGASTEAKDRRGRLPLTSAIYSEEAAVVQLLLDWGAKPQLCDYWSYYDSLLAFTIRLSTPDVLKVLLRYYDRAIKSANGPLPEGIPTPTKALQTAIKEGGLRMLDALIEIWDQFDDLIYENGIQVGTVLHYAAGYGSVDVMKWVLEHQSIVTDANKVVVGYYGTPLQAAITIGEDSLCKVTSLFEWGAQASAQGGYAGTALNAAAAKLNINVASAILDVLEKEEVNIVAGFWGSPIEATVAAPSSTAVGDMLNLLLSKGASAALWGGYWETPLHAAAFLQDISIVKCLLSQKGVSKDEPDRMGRLPLHMAAMQGNWELVQELLSDKSTITSKDNQGRNVLHIAAGVGKLSVVRSILENEQITAQLIEAPDNDGWTALHWACRSNSEVVDLLISKGASKTAMTAEMGWLPFHVAVYHNRSFSDQLKGSSVTDDLDGSPLTEPTNYMSALCDCCQCVSL